MFTSMFVYVCFPGPIFTTSRYGKPVILIGPYRFNKYCRSKGPKAIWVCEFIFTGVLFSGKMEKNKRKQYTEEALNAALEEIRNGMTVYKASQQFDIPETTLRNKRDGLHSDKCGVPAVFSKHEENRIVDWIHYLGRSGFPITKVQLIETVAKLTEQLKRTNRFKDGVPGKKWIHGFLKRNPTVSLRISKNLPTSRNQVTEEALKSGFQRVYEYFEDSQRIFNCDETGFFLCPKEKQVLVRKGSKRVYNRVANDEKECLTVLVNVSANGDIAPPMVLFPYKRMPKHQKFSVSGTFRPDETFDLLIPFVAPNITGISTVAVADELSEPPIFETDEIFDQTRQKVSDSITPHKNIPRYAIQSLSEKN
ncbi:helix-turn-helix, psq domain-containing protein [Phthorimaea operculella]|nr:helix-turn-helix, psq domain-containing protein [Phthorimaea operculella]